MEEVEMMVGAGARSRKMPLPCCEEFVVENVDLQKEGLSRKAEGKQRYIKGRQKQTSKHNRVTSRVSLRQQNSETPK